MKLEIRGLCKNFGKTEAVRDFSLEVEEGEAAAVLGPSGCGKSTLLSCIAGFENPHEGEIYLNGKCLYSALREINVPPEKRNLGFVFQNFALWPHMTVEKNIAYPLTVSGKDKKYIKDHVGGVLRMLRMEDMEQRYPSMLSGGEKQRVALGRALIGEPEMLLLDEPLSNLDARLREEMQYEIREIQRNTGITILHVTHDQNEALAMSDRIILMNEGELLQHGKPEEVYCSPDSEFAAAFIGTCNIIRSPERTIAVRPEDIRMSRDSSRNGLLSGKGVVLDRVYRGAHLIYIVDTAQGHLKVQVHPEEIYSAGETVFYDASRTIDFPASPCPCRTRRRGKRQFARE